MSWPEAFVVVGVAWALAALVWALAALVYILFWPNEE